MSMSAPVRLQTKLAIAGTVAALGAFAYFVHHRLDVTGHPLANVPRGASAVLYVDVAAVRGSSLWERWVIDGGRDRGLRRLREECGLDPLASVSDLTAFVIGTEGRSLDHVGFLARGELEHEALVRCMAKVVGGAGGEVEQLEIDGVPAVAGGRGRSRIAFLGRSGLAWGSHETVERIIKTVRGALRASEDDPSIADPFQEAAGADVVVVGRVPSHWREALSRRLLDSQEALSRALAPMERIAFAAQVGDPVKVDLAITFASEEDAARFTTELQRRRESLERQPAVALTVAGRALRRLEIRTASKESRLSISLSSETAHALVDLASALSQPEEPPRMRSPQPTTAPPGEAEGGETEAGNPQNPDIVIERDRPAP